MILLTKLGFGKYSDIFMVKEGNLSFAMKISYYREENVRDFMEKMREGDVESAKKIKDSDAISVSARFSKIAKKMKEYNITPHFINVYDSRDIKNFVEKIPLLASRLQELSPYQRKYNHVTFMELFDSDLTSFLLKKKYTDDFVRTCMFQVLYSIASTQLLISGWRHNDLSTNNVLVKKSLKKTSSYDVNGKLFFTTSNHDIVIIDYDFVHAHTTKLDNHRVRSGNFRVSPEKNDSYDSHFFLKSVLKCINKNTVSNIDATKKFLHGLNLKENDRYDKEILELHPLEILKHSYFDILKNVVIEPGKKYTMPPNISSSVQAP